ncbi:MAG: hypothetical protein PPP58_08395 [Natronomonas sp.]
MVDFPWDSADTETGTTAGEDAIVVCAFQDGTLRVYENRIQIERAAASTFTDKEISMERIESVTYSKRLVISYLQIEERGFENDTGGVLSTPVDENTLHFGRGKRSCAKRAEEAIQDAISRT